MQQSEEELNVAIRASRGSWTKDEGGVHQRLILGFIVVGGHKITPVLEEEEEGFQAMAWIHQEDKACTSACRETVSWVTTQTNCGRGKGWLEGMLTGEDFCNSCYGWTSRNGLPQDGRDRARDQHGAEARRGTPPHPCFHSLSVQCSATPIMDSPLPDVQPSRVIVTSSPADTFLELSLASTTV